MKILQLGKFYPIGGGVEKVMYDLMTGLAAKGVECDMMCAESDGHGRVRPVAKGARSLTHHTWVKAASTTIAPSMITFLRRIAAEYDVIHVHHPDPMGALASRLSGYKGKVVLHWHSDIVKQKKFLRFYVPLQNWLVRRADAIVGTSPVYLDSSPRLSDEADKKRRIPIGIEPMRPDEEGAARIRERWKGKKIVFFLGRLIAYKGVSYLVDAAAKPPDDYVVLIGGKGILRESVERHVEQLGLRKRWCSAGEIPHEDLSAYYTACDVFCLPSVMKTEAFGIVQIEAMSLGKPVVATRIEGSGTAWVNSHGESGLNAPVRDADALAEAIRGVLVDEETYRGFSRRAKARFDAMFRIDNMIDSCIELYESLLSSRP